MAFAPGLAKLPRGRIVSLEPESQEPGSKDGLLTTETLRYAGSTLTLNADASQGSIAVELLDEDGNPVEGCSLSDSIPIKEDGFRCAVKWQGDRELVKACTEGTEIAGYEPALRRPQKLRFHIKNAKLFSFRID